MLNKQSFINTKPASLTEIEVPELGIVYIKKWSAKARMDFLKKIVKVDGQNVDVDTSDVFMNMVKLVQITVCNENGERIFDDSEEDTNILLDMDADIITLLYTESANKNGLTQESVKEAAKNS